MTPYERGCMAGLQPDPDYNVSEWSEQYRILSQVASSEPGHWRNDRTPYLTDIMDALSASHPATEVVFMKGAQVGGTEAGNNWIGYMIDQAPGPMLVVQPTVDMGKRWSKQRLGPLLQDTDRLKGKIQDPRARDSGNTIQLKEFKGGQIVITGANSAVGLRSMPVRYLFLDEVDAYPLDVSGEGDPVNLAIQRTMTFARRKIFMVSTPTIRGLSRIERAYQKSDQRQYHVPCPTCEFMQPLVFENLVYTNPKEPVFYRCARCAALISEYEKTAMLTNGKWVAMDPHASIRGYHISSLYSPVGWFSWNQVIQAYRESQGNDQLKKVFTNTILGLSFGDDSEAVEWERLYERRAPYRIGVVPKKGILLTAGVDVQKDRVEVEVVAWGEDGQSWSVDYKIFDGEVGEGSVLSELEAYIQRPFMVEGGGQKSIVKVAIDTGFASQHLYAWLRRLNGRIYMAIKGRDQLDVPLARPKLVEVRVNGKTLKQGLKLWSVGVSLLKEELFQNLKLSVLENGNHPPKYCHFPDYEPEYFKQLTAEQLIIKNDKGKTKRSWERTRPRNEALDCRIYARAAAVSLGIDRFTENEWARLKAR